MTPVVVRWIFGSHGDQQLAVLTGIEVSLAGSGRAGDDIRNSIVIGVARGFDAEAELVTGFAIYAPQQFARFCGVDVDVAGVRASDIRGRRRSHEIGNAVAVDIADRACDPAELIVGGLAVPFAND